MVRDQTNYHVFTVYITAAHHIEGSERSSLDLSQILLDTDFAEDENRYYVL